MHEQSKRRAVVRIETAKGPSHVPTLKTFGNLCVHKDNEYPRLYTITHVPTGLAVRKKLTRFVAIRAAELMNTYQLWNIDGSSVYSSIKEIVESCIDQAANEQLLTSTLTRFSPKSPQKDLFPSA